jgi:hypothetical protein
MRKLQIENYQLPNFQSNPIAEKESPMILPQSFCPD